MGDIVNPVAVVRHVRDGDMSYDALMFVCPGCQTHHTSASGLHMLPVNSTVKSPSWDWDGNLEAPTLRPSILTHLGPASEWTCHSFLVAGVFDFLGDCTHQYAGMSVPMPPLEDWMLE